MPTNAFVVLLPPSESKAVGGEQPPLELGSLFLPELSTLRKQAVRSIIQASRLKEAPALFKLGPKLLGEIEHNRSILTAATMPALERYTGVLYDEVAATKLSVESWEFAKNHILIHSALFGPVRGSDLIPNYRYSPQLALPNFSAKRHWAAKLPKLLSGSAEFFLDLRAKNFLALAPLDMAGAQIYIEIVSEDAHGITRALNHFNKQTKGIILAALLATRPTLSGPEDVAEWFESIGFRFKAVGKRHWQVISR